MLGASGQAPRDEERAAGLQPHGGARWARSWASPWWPRATSTSSTRRTRSTASCCWRPRSFDDARPAAAAVLQDAPTRCWRNFPTSAQEKAYEVVVEQPQRDRRHVRRRCVPCPRAALRPEHRETPEQRLKHLVYGKLQRALRRRLRRSSAGSASRPELQRHHRPRLRRDLYERAEAGAGLPGARLSGGLAAASVGSSIVAYSVRHH